LTVFSAAVGVHAKDAASALELIAFMTAPPAAPTIEMHGMMAEAPARG